MRELILIELIAFPLAASSCDSFQVSAPYRFGHTTSAPSYIKRTSGHSGRALTPARPTKRRKQRVPLAGRCYWSFLFFFLPAYMFPSNESRGAAGYIKKKDIFIYSGVGGGITRATPQQWRLSIYFSFHRKKNPQLKWAYSFHPSADNDPVV